MKLEYLGSQTFFENENIKTSISINEVFGEFCEKECAIIGRNGRENEDKRSDSFDSSLYLFPFVSSFSSFLSLERSPWVNSLK